MTIYLSWSRLRTHEECRQKGYLSRTGRKPTIDNYRNFFPGTVVDRVVREWLLNSPQDNPGKMPSMVEEIVERELENVPKEGGVISWRNSSDKGMVIADCKEAVTKIEPDLNKFVVPFDYTPDFSFKAPIFVKRPDGGKEKIVLNGYMDILVRDNQDRFMIWDVKMTRDNGYWRKTVGQLMFYDLALQVLYGQGAEATGLLQPMCDNRYPHFRFTDEDRAQMRQRIVLMANDIMNNVTTPRPDTTLCTYCNVRHACEKFQPVVRNGQKRVSF